VKDANYRKFLIAIKRLKELNLDSIDIGEYIIVNKQKYEKAKAKLDAERATYVN